MSATATDKPKVTGTKLPEAEVCPKGISPGIRWAHKLNRGLQIVPGIAVPVPCRAGDAKLEP